MHRNIALNLSFDMIIFNLYAIVVAFFIGLAALPFILLSYFGVIGDEFAMFAIAWEILPVCYLCHRAGLKGRLFFIPMWILALPLGPLATYGIYGWTGIIVGLSLVFSVIGLALFAVMRSEKKRMEAIDGEQVEIEYNADEPAEFWNAVKEKLFFPTFSRITPSVSAYNLRVVSHIEQNALSLDSLHGFKNTMDAFSKTAIRENLDKSSIKRFHKELDDKIEVTTTLRKKGQPAV